MAADSTSISISVEVVGGDQAAKKVEDVGKKAEVAKKGGEALRKTLAEGLSEVARKAAGADSSLTSVARIIGVGITGGPVQLGLTALVVGLGKVAEGFAKSAAHAKEMQERLAEIGKKGVADLDAFADAMRRIREEERAYDLQRNGTPAATAAATAAFETATSRLPEAHAKGEAIQGRIRDQEAIIARQREILQEVTKEAADDTLKGSTKGVGKRMLAIAEIDKATAAMQGLKVELAEAQRLEKKAESEAEAAGASLGLAVNKDTDAANDEKKKKAEAEAQQRLEEQKRDKERRQARTEQAREEYDAAIQEKEAFLRVMAGLEEDLYVARAKLAEEWIENHREQIIKDGSEEEYQLRLNAAKARTALAEAAVEQRKMDENAAEADREKQEEEARQKEAHDRFLEKVQSSEGEAEDLERQVHIAERARELAKSGIEVAQARKQAEHEVTLKLLEQAEAQATVGAASEEEAERAVQAIKRKKAALQELWKEEAEQAKAPAKESKPSFFQEDAAKLAQMAVNGANNAMQKWLDTTLKTSAAQRELASLSSKTAAQEQAESSAALQTFLADLSKQAAAEAMMKTAAGLGFLAVGKLDSAGLAFASAALYGVVAGGVGAAAWGIGQTRGNTQAEDEQLKAARAKQGGGSRSSGGGASTGSSGSSGKGGSGGGGINIYITGGGGIFSTSAEVGRALKVGLAYAGRTT